MMHLPATMRIARLGGEHDPLPAIGGAHGNHYATLQVKPYADLETIRGAYRRIARHAHPDLNPAPEATRHMQAVNEAYTVLRDPARRAAYDRDRLALALRDSVSAIPGTPAARSFAVRPWRGPRRRKSPWHVLGALFTTLAIAVLFWTHSAGATRNIAMDQPIAAVTYETDDL